mgnify:CR=1 FL=1
MLRQTNRFSSILFALAVPALLLIILFAQFQPTFAKTLRLIPQGVGSNCFAQLESDGVTTYFDLQTAVDNALVDDVVKVAGYCAGVQTRVGIQQTAYVSKPLTIRGGYTTTNWIVSNPILNPTTLDAQRGGRVLLISDTVPFHLENIIVTGGQILGDGLCADLSSNCGGGVMATGSLTLTNVQVISNTAEREGGGVVALAPAQIIGSTFVDNTALNVSPGPSAPSSGALALFAPSSITATQFISNVSTLSGGAVSAFAEITVTNSLFQENISLNNVGGGLRVSFDTALSGTVLISNTTFLSNTAQNNAFSGITDGGAVYAFNTNLIVVNSHFENNHCIDSDEDCNGGGIYLLASVFEPVRGSLTLKNSDFISNSARGNGGGVATNGTTIIEGGSFIGNRAEGGVTAFADGGGGINASAIYLTDTLFLNNSSGESGGGLMTRLGLSINNTQFIGNEAEVHGGGLYSNVFTGTVFITDTDFISNTALENGGGYYSTGLALAIIKNGRFENNQSFAAELDGGSVLIENGGGGLWTQGNLILDETTFANNYALTSGGGARVQGSAAISGTLFTNNQADGGASLIAFGGGGLYVVNNLALTNTQFISNTAVRGGGVLAVLATTGEGNLFQANQVSNVGGGMYTGGALTLMDTLFIRNTAVSTGTVRGGGLFAEEQISLNNVDFISNVVDGNFGAGGGLFANEAMMITNGRFQYNQANFSGGGAANAFSAILMDNVIFQENSSEGSGGAMSSFTSFPEALTMTNTQFLSNTARLNGGALNHASGNIVMENGLFLNNVSQEGQGGGLDMSGSLMGTNAQFINNRAQLNGGGAFVNSDINLSNSTFLQNETVAGSGGGLYAHSTATLNNTQILTNSAGVNGGGAAVNFRAFFEDVLFENNTAQGFGGGSWQGRIFTISNTQFINNQAALGGGLAFTTTGGTNPNRMFNSLFVDNQSTDDGAAIYVSSTRRPLELIHNTIVNEAALNPNTAVLVITGPVTLTNNIVTSHTVGLQNISGTVASDFNLYFDNGVNQLGSIVGNVGHQNGDPLFLDPANRDYHISNLSPAVNNGTTVDVFQDFEGDIRPTDTDFDIGMDEVSFDLDIAKFVFPSGNVLPGQRITYTIVYTNVGQHLAQNVKITDTVPTLLQDVSFTSAGASIVQTNSGVMTYTWDVEDLASPDGGVIFVSGTVDPLLNSDTTFTNTVQIGPMSGDTNHVNNQAQVVTMVDVPNLSFAAANFTTDERAGTALITVTLDAINPWADSTAVYSITNGTASDGLDYIAASGTITIPAGQTQASLPITILDDYLVEDDETVQISLSTPQGASLVPSRDEATLTIVDDDVFIEFSDTAYLVAEADGLATITVTLQTPSVEDVIVDYRTDDNTAVAGADYTAVSGTLTFPAGTTILTFTIPILDDIIFEPSETVTLTLNNIVNGESGIVNPATLIILSDEALPEVLVVPTILNLAEGSSDDYAVWLATEPTDVVTITMATNGETTLSPTALTFTPTNWQTPQPVSVTAVIDSDLEGWHTDLITHIATSNDSNYNNISINDVTVNISDIYNYTIFLPIIFKQQQTAPDLIVQSIDLSTHDVSIVIANIGSGPVLDTFWVDLYINPTTAPTAVNQVWHVVGKEGIVWGITDIVALAPGGQITLTLNHPSLTPEKSNYSGTFNEEDIIYVQVDSAHTGTSYGGVLEAHEQSGGTYNNIAQYIKP